MSSFWVILEFFDLLEPDIFKHSDRSPLYYFGKQYILLFTKKSLWFAKDEIRCPIQNVFSNGLANLEQQWAAPTPSCQTGSGDGGGRKRVAKAK